MPSKHDYRPLPASELEALAVNQVLSSLDGKNGVRLSLAGAQDKLPVVVDDGKLLLPRGAAASTHILKFRNSHFKHLPANEVLTSMIAVRMGLPVMEAALWPVGREGACLVARYDRLRAPDGRIRRLHQEDLCQALGTLPIQKYEKEGGPSFDRCFDVVRRASAQPLVDGQSMIRWLAFNVLVFNADAHAKNLSLLYDGGSIRLAPFYDLVCTRAYERLATDLAMSVGGEFEPTNVRGTHWEALARQLALGTRFVLDSVRESAERMPDAVSDAVRDFKDRYGDRPVLQMVVPKLRRQAKRVLQLLA